MKPEDRNSQEEYLKSYTLTDEVLDQYSAEDEIKKIRRADDFQDQVKKSFLGFDDETEKGDKLPWGKTTDIRFRPGEITIWTGYNGHKKSMVLGQVCLGFISQDKVSLIISPEMHPKKTLKRMCRQYVGVSEPSIAFQEKFFDFCSSKLWLYDQTGTIDANKILNVMRYCQSSLMGISHFFIDSLMKMGINEDDLNKQKWFVDELATFAKDYSCHVHLVAHSRKPISEAAPSDKYGTAGSANITNLADNVIVVFENKKEDRVYDNMLLCKKQRNYEGEGDPEPIYKFWFCEKSLQFKEREKQSPMNDEDWNLPAWK